MPLVAGVDSSTSACKLEVRDLETGELVASARAPHPPTSPPVSEQDPREWWRAFETVAAQAGLFERHRPAALAVAAQQHGLVVSDASGRVLRPAKLWNDTESATDAAELLELLPGGAGAWAKACGSVPVASFTITKLRWLRRCEPESFSRMAAVELPHDWLSRQLTGRRATDRGDASGTGYWSPAEGSYRFDLLALVDSDLAWQELLPEVLQPTEVAGSWQEVGAVVAPGTGDNMAAALGLGLGPGDLAISLGTSGTAFTVSERPSADPEGTVAGFADATGCYLPLVCTLNATKVTDAFARLLGVSREVFDGLALEAPPGAGGLVLVPYLDGERTPNLPRASGLISGLRSEASREQLARAAVEGVVCNLLLGAEHLARWEPRVASGRLFLLGGGARSSAYRQVLADLSGREVTVAASEEPVALGAALQAAAVFSRTSFEELAKAWGVREGTTVEPNPAVDGQAILDAYRRAAERAAE